MTAFVVANRDTFGLEPICRVLQIATSTVRSCQDEEFTVALRRYAGARELARESTADRRPIYEQKARAAQQTMVSWLRSKLPTAMSVTYRGQS